LLPAGASAQSANLVISASVTANCLISASPVAFGTYDPLGANATIASPLDASGGVTVACTKGSAPTINLGPGSNFGTTRQMSAAGGLLLGYELYQDAGHATLWGSGAAALTAGAATDKQPRTFTVFGRVPGGQDVGAGTYGDTVLATFNF
jgi:spore coat protein U-like protein